MSHPIRPFQLGFARASLNDDRIVRDLVPGSAADLAGVRNGDVIVDSSDINKVRGEETERLTLTLRRGETQTTVTYLPRGAPVEGYRWVRDDTRRSALRDERSNFTMAVDTACQF